MELKRYQERVLKETEAFLRRLDAHRRAGAKHPTLDAWGDVGALGACKERRNGLDQDMAAFCIKVPTGGGKTLLATQILGQIYRTVLKERKGAGLALWVVPSDQILKDTVKRLRDRRDDYRLKLEHAVSRRIEIWEKRELHRLTPLQLSENLNILVIMLSSANRETRDQLKIFQDGGGNIVRHFPPEDDSDANAALKERIPNLDMLSEDPALVKTSLANLVALCEPPVVLDEGHKAYSPLAKRTLERFNASVVLELSATPRPDEQNILCRVSGQELLREEMIKLPLNVSNSDDARWQNVLTKVKERRAALERLGRAHGIRPIVLVQVERTGKEQRGGSYVHSEDVKEYLVQRLGVPADQIAIKSSTTDDIEGIDLLDEGCRVNWIITRSALAEGWDCPFAYLLVTLVNTRSERALMQLVGRVLRQPGGRRTGVDALDESYVYCLRLTAQQVLKQVKGALEREGYEGDAESIVDRSDDSSPEEAPVARVRPLFRKHYRRFEGKIYLPTFCVKDGDGYNGLDYFSHLIAEVGVERFDYAGIDWDFSRESREAAERFYRITLGQSEPTRLRTRAEVDWEGDGHAQAWLAGNLPFEHFGFKEYGRIVERTVDRLFRLDGRLKGRLGLIKFDVRDRLVGFIEEQTDLQTARAFQALHESRRLRFYLHCVECRFEIPQEVTLRSRRRLVHADTNEPVQRSLFDPVVQEDFNDYEKDVALCIDRHPEVLWWYRNLVGPECFAIQGYKRERLYPDFVVQQGKDGTPAPSVLVLETKGGHLGGDPRTEYTRELAGYFEKVGRAVPWQELGKGFDKETFRFQVLDQDEHGAWKQSLMEFLGTPR